MTLLEIETSESIMIGLLSLCLLAVGWLFTQIKILRSQVSPQIVKGNDEIIKLKLQACERLILLADRLGLGNLVSRTPHEGETVLGHQTNLIAAINAEIEYNISQQIYVNKDIWQALIRLKDQNIYIINQLATTLPPQNNAIELSRRILEYTLQENAEVNVVVLDALRAEASRLLA